MNPVRAQEARALQSVRDAAELAALEAWRAANEAARLAKLAADLEALGFDGGLGGLVVVDSLESTSTTSALSANMGHQIFSALSAISVAFDGVSPLESPNFTGAPTAPTCTDGDNSQKLANTQFVQTAIYQAVANLVSTTPAALDTLMELAAALGNDPEFATHVADALGVRLRFDGPQSLSGAQQLQAIANLNLGSMALQEASSYLSVANSRYVVHNNVDLSYSVTSDDITANGRVLLISTNANPNTVGINTPLSFSAPVGSSLTVIQGGAGVTSIVGEGVATITGNGVFTRQNEAKTLIAVSNTEWRVLGAQ